MKILFNKLFLHFLTFLLKKSQISRIWGYLLIASFFTGYLVQVATYNTTHQCISPLIFILESSLLIINHLPLRWIALGKYFLLVPLKKKIIILKLFFQKMSSLTETVIFGSTNFLPFNRCGSLYITSHFSVCHI